MKKRNMFFQVLNLLVVFTMTIGSPTGALAASIGEPVEAQSIASEVASGSAIPAAAPAEPDLPEAQSEPTLEESWSSLASTLELAPMMDGSGNADVIYNVGCMEESAGFSLNCTANDINIAKATNIAILDDGCAYPGDTVTFKADFEVLLTAQARYDVGLWFSQDGDPNGDAAKTGTCTAVTPPYAPDPPWLDADQLITGQESDTCGDINDAHNPLYPSVTLTVVCTDDDANGKLDLPNCTSWRQPGDNSLCTSPVQAVPGAPSKCKCDTGFNVDIPVPGQIIVDKVTNPSGLTTSFDFTLTGNGITPINFNLTDSSDPYKSSYLYAGTYSIVETANASYSTTATCSDGSPANAVDLQPGEIVTCTFTNKLLTGTLIVEKTLVNDNLGPKSCSDFSYTVDGGTAVPFESDCSNSQTVLAGSHTIVEAGVPIDGYTTTYNNCTNVNVPAGGSATCTITNDDIAMPAINVAKSSTTTEITAAGQVVPYTFIVTNTGNQTLTGITVVDPNCDAAPAYVSGDTNTDSMLQVSESWTYTCSHTVTQAEIDSQGGGDGDLDNTVTADSNESEPDTADYFIPITYNPLLSITKVATETGYNAVGDVLNYTITATNIGNTTLAAVTVTDALVSNLTCTPANGSALAPGASMTCTATHTVTQADLDAGHWANTSCVDDGALGAPQVCDAEDVPGTKNPLLSIAKVATEETYDAVGDILHYTITATNIGNVTLASVNVTDPLVSNLTCTPANGSVLAPGASMACTAIHTVTQADIDAGHWANTSCVDDGPGGAPQVCDGEDVPADKKPHLTINKVAAETTYDSVGDILNYTITATNDGNTTLAVVTVTDPLVSGLTCTPANGSPLAPGESMTCMATHTVTQADLDAGHWANTACVDDGPLGAPEVCDGEDVPGTKNPLLSISKVATEATYAAVGDILHYTITATNIGNVTLTSVTVTDALVSDLSCTPANGSSLAPGASMTCTATHTVTQADLDAGHWANTSCVDDGALGAPQVCDGEDVPGTKNPLLSISKVATESTFDAVGDILHYTITATNVGNVTLASVTVSDPLVSDLSCIPANGSALAPGAVMTCTATHTVSQADIDGGHWANTSCVDDGTAGAPEACDDEDVPADQNPALTLDKSGTFGAGANGFADPGELISYEFLVTNTGNVTLTGVTVTDPKVSNITCPVDTLAVGASMTCTGTYAVTQTDIDAGFVYNLATADSKESGPDDGDNNEPLPQNPLINLVKTGTFDAGEDGYANVGELISYEFLVTNTGNVTLTGINVTDPKVSNITCPVDTLAVGANMTCTGSYAVTQADIDAGSVYNMATADSNESGPDDDDNNEPLPQNPVISLVKSGTFGAGTDGFADPGELISYEFLVTNEGNVTLTGITVTDPIVSPITCPATTLAVGADMTCTGTYAVTQADIDAGFVYNLATADSTESVPDDGDNNEPLPQNPVISLVKSGTFGAGADGYADPGELITYEFLVTNEGNVTLTGITVTDPKVSSISCPADTLAVGASMTCTGTYAVTQADIDAGFVYNLATADSNESGPDDGDNNEPLPQNPALTLDKTGTFDAGADGYAQPGELISYEFLVTNTGNVTLTGITVTDPKVSPITCPADTLAVGASMTCTGIYAVMQTDIDAGFVYNLATADSKESPPDDGDNNEPLPQNPALALDKSGTFDAGADGFADPGELISYTFVVSNTGNVTLTGITVTDPKVSLITCPATTLAVGTSMTCTGTYAVAQEDIDAGFVYNLATADSTESGPDEDDNNEPLPQNPAINLVKTGTFDAGTDGYANVGELISYEFLVTNTGNVTLTGVTVTDPKVSNITCPVTTLAVGASMTCAGTYAVMQADIDAGSVYNMATADSTQSEPDTDDETVTLPQNPAINIVKTTNNMDGGYFLVGSTINWKYVVTNTGNVTLSNIAVSDNKAVSVTCPATTLAVGASMTCTATGKATIGLYENTGTVTADDPQGDDATDSDDSSYFGADPEIDVEKFVSIDGGATWVDADSATGPYLNTGTAPQFKFVVTNTGNVALSSVGVTDTKFTLPVGCIASTLAVGASDDCIITGTWASGQHTNTATASGSFTDDNAATETDTDTDAANYFGADPKIDLTKTGAWVDGNANGFADVGELINYTFVVKNTGNVALSSVTVTDPKVSPISCPKTTLAVNESMTCNGSYTLTLADIYSGKVDNTATASGSFTDDNNNTKTATDLASATVTLPLEPTGQIRPTRTSCEQFRDGTGETMQQYYPPYGYVYYMLKGKLINSINPGVFFYYTKVTLSGGDFAISVLQSNDKGWPKIPAQVGDNIVLWDSNCDKVQDLTAAFDPLTGNANISGSVPAGTYYVSVKWEPSASYNSLNNVGLVGYAPTGKPLVTYSFQAYLKDSDYDGLIASSGASQIIAPKK